MESKNALLLSAALAALFSTETALRSPTAERLGGHRVLAQGILVQPDAGALEPPSIADEDQEGDDDDSGENVPPVVAPSPGVIQVVPAVPVRPESPEQELERPGARQDQDERGDTRQQDLETPEGPGIKY